MPAFVFTLGSLGDILAIAQIAWQLSRVLSDLTGASGSLTALIADVRAFASTLQDVKEASERRHVILRPDIATILEAIKGKVDAFNRTMTGSQGPGVAAPHRYWEVASWEILGGHKEVSILQRRLRDHLSILQANLS
ncbi:hypothetical protein AURDEDRAFT_127531 [Auricularia subglabra TFB-10046 SS5]|nr:hypothetical protein AURDEDRAFT_127531 [Auricularia subglabra TFB-10046 SS5]